MGGTAQYTDREIIWVLKMQYVFKLAEDDIMSKFQEQFGRVILKTQLKYLKTKYGHEARFNSPEITGVVEYFTPDLLERDRLQGEAANSRAQDGTSMMEQETLHQREMLEQHEIQQYQDLPGQQDTPQYQDLEQQQETFQYQDLQQQGVSQYQDLPQQQRTPQYQQIPQQRTPQLQRTPQYQETLQYQQIPQQRIPQLQDIPHNQGIRYQDMLYQELPHEHHGVIEPSIEIEPGERHETPFSIEGVSSDRMGVESGHSTAVPGEIDSCLWEYRRHMQAVASLPPESLTMNTLPPPPRSFGGIQAPSMYLDSILPGPQNQKAYGMQGRQVPMAQMHPMQRMPQVQQQMHPMQMPQIVAPQLQPVRPTKRKAGRQKRQTAQDPMQAAGSTAPQPTRRRKRQRSPVDEPDLNNDFPGQSSASDIIRPSKIARYSHTPSSQAPQSWALPVGDISGEWPQYAPQVNPFQDFMTPYTATGLGGNLMMQNSQYVSYNAPIMAQLSGLSQPEFRRVGLLDEEWLRNELAPVPVQDQMLQPLGNTEISGTGTNEEEQETRGATSLGAETGTEDESANDVGDAETASTSNEPELPATDFFEGLGDSELELPTTDFFQGLGDNEPEMPTTDFFQGLEDNEPERLPSDLLQSFQDNEASADGFADFWSFDPTGEDIANNWPTPTAADQYDVGDWEVGALMSVEAMNAIIDNDISGGVQISPAPQVTEGSTPDAPAATQSTKGSASASPETAQK